ncbi:hypothetical protein [Polyangium sp. 6x1]|uniref:hypothetical protein n=1 Tax=Polyangium sp. 6x1 TaxID=3042689 RepID=UPI002482E672|nr:hypothetical protein [Polyangium sp. 6x1]MDI1452050.1 hypothetical protein [Polyangium sp. 6x1]
MNERAGRARILTIVALAGLVGATALLVRSRLAEGTDVPATAARPAGMEHAVGASTAATETTAKTAPEAPTIPAAAPAAEPPQRPAIDPEEYVRNGSKEPLVPRELRADAEVDSSRGTLTAEPLVPRVLEVNVEVSPRGALTMEPLQPRVHEVQVETGHR